MYVYIHIDVVYTYTLYRIDVDKLLQNLWEAQHRGMLRKGKKREAAQREAEGSSAEIDWRSFG